MFSYILIYDIFTASNTSKAYSDFDLAIQDLTTVPYRIFHTCVIAPIWP